ncbi:MAG: hypothetical protein LBK94_00015 [Prevotellaceae bacterium]|jgi:hypothetical protein|nr:hypothetical protein [Prevotellaceae bacterium]
MKKLILSIQERLKTEVPELLYIDKDWGQLNYEQPPVKFPCALIDISSAEYAQFSASKAQRAKVTIEIIIVNRNLVPSSAGSVRKADSHRIFEVMEKIHDALQLFYDADKSFTPLVRTSLAKQRVDTSAEVYIMYYQTTYTE